jgi:site-specific recombinase XerD
MISKKIRCECADAAAACVRATRLDESLEDFLLSMWSESGLAARTIEVARSVLRDYLKWLNFHKMSWRQVDADDVRRFLRARACCLSTSTIVLKQWVMRRLYVWAESEALAFVAPSGFVLPIRPRPMGAPYAPSVASIQRLLELPDTTTHVGIRDRAILELLYATGMRACELLSLDFHALDPESRHAQIVGKGRRERIVVFGEHAADWVRHYCEEKWPRLSEQHSPIHKWNPSGLPTMQSCPRRRSALATNRPTRWATRGAPRVSSYATSLSAGSSAAYASSGVRLSRLE